MVDAALAVYVSAFVERCREAAIGTCLAVIDEPGLCGLPVGSDDVNMRLLALDDRAFDQLEAMLPRFDRGMVRVLPNAPRCEQLLAALPGWQIQSVIPMVSRDLGALPELRLPADLTLRPVRRLDSDPPDGEALDDAVQVAVRAATTSKRSYGTLATHLRAMPPSVHLLAATDGDGVARATSGYGTVGADASVIFVNTDPDWRHRGIGSAMTSAALRAARADGARRASLDASLAGASIYARLGFEALPSITRVFRGL